MRELSAEDTASYKSFMRMDVATFRNLADIISPRVSKKSTVMRSPISVQQRLALTLRYLATGESFRSLEFQFRISRPAISYIVYEVSLPKQFTYRRATFHLFRKCELNLRGSKVKFPYLLVVVETLFGNEVNKSTNKFIEKSPNLRNMRDNMKLTLDRPNSNVGKLSFKHRFAMAWNFLPQSAKSIEDHHRFKNKLRYLSTIIDNISFNQSALIYTKDLTNYKYF